jgi:hypothetical protein
MVNPYLMHRRRAFRTGGGWTPAQLSTALWLDASDNATLFDSTTGGSLPAADGTVARWEDKSTNARHVIQETSGNRPIRKIGLQNGLDIVLFNGSNNSLVLGSNLSLGTSHTIIIAAKNTATITASTDAQILLSGGSYTHPSTTTSEFLFGIGSLTSNLTNERLYNVAVAHATLGAQVYGYAKTDADIPNSFIAVNSFTTSSNTFVGRLDGATSFASVSAAGGYTGTNTRYPTLLRAVGYRHFNNSLFWNGQILEVIVVPSALSSATIEQVEGYLAHKWGLTANLPGDHPYKSVAP